MTTVQLVFGVLLALALLITVIGFPRRYGALSGRSRLFRTAGIGLIDLMLALALVFVSSSFIGQTGKIQALAYLITFVLVGLCLVCIALLDALEALVVLRREQQVALKAALQETADAVRRRSGESS